MVDTTRPPTGDRYARIRQILDEAAGSAAPGDDGQRRAWARCLADLEAAAIHGIAMIAPAGTAERGARCGLVVGLRGPRPFDGTQFPPLPWGATRVAEPDIRLIAGWIDDGLPETDVPHVAAPGLPAAGAEVVPTPDETDDPNADRLGAIKARRDVEHLGPTEPANLRAVIAPRAG